MAVIATLFQVTRIINGHTRGVSSLTWAIICFMNVGWAAYFYFGENQRIYASITMIFLASNAVLIFTKTAKNKLSISAITFLLSASILGVTIYNPALGLTIVSFVSAPMYAPQCLVAVRAVMNGTSLDGVSWVAWLWNVLVSLAWLGTAITTGLPSAIIANLFPAALSIVTTLAVLQSRKTAREKLDTTTHSHSS